MRVLVLTNMWPTSDRPWFGIFTQRQVAALERAGVEVTVLPVTGERRAKYARAATHVLRLNLGPRRYDLVHAHTGHCGALTCLQLRYPVVMSYVGYDLDAHLGEAETVRTTIERVAFRWLGVLLAGTIAKSARGARRLPRLAAGRNAVIPNGVDRELFRPLPRSEARARLGWAHEDPVALFAADPARKEKRFELCEAAVARAQTAVARLRLEVAGEVPPEQMPVLCSAADVLLLTSVAEGSPNVVKEAMACNLPVVSADVGDVSEVLGGASLCHVCPPDPGCLADAVVDVIRALPERSDGRERTEWLSVPNITERILSTYAGARERGPGPLGFVRRG